MALMLRMAWADARRHRLRTFLATLLVALPSAAAVVWAAVSLGVPSSADAALRRVPSEAQARIVAMALPRTGRALPQPPEGFFVPPPAATNVSPASSAELAAVLPPGDRLHPFWTSGDLLLAKGAFDPFAAELDINATSIQSSILSEAGVEIMAMLRADLSAGREPAAHNEIALPARLAAQMSVALGDQVTLFGPPATGWMGAEGNIANALAGQSRSFAVVGLTDGSDDRMWATTGWLSASVGANSKGINNSYLLIGDEPLTWTQVQQLNNLQAWAISRHVLTNYPDDSELYPSKPDPQALMATMVGLVVTGLAALALLGFTITPAFTVTAEQSQRSLGLAAAAGASPRDLRRIITTQGVLVGLCGGLTGSLIGTVGGLMVIGMRFADDPAVELFPWWFSPIALAMGVLAGWASAIVPARRVAKVSVVHALAGRPITARPTTARLPWLGPVLVLAGVGLAIFSLRITPIDFTNPNVAPRTPASASLTIAAAIILVGAGALASLSLIFAAFDRLSSRLPVGARLGLGDARRHRSRAWPAAAAVLMVTMVATLLPISVESLHSNDRDSTNVLSPPGHLVAAPKAPVSDAFDAKVLDLGTELVADEVAIQARYRVHSWGYREKQPAALPTQTCPPGQSPNLLSRISRDAAFTCTTRMHDASYLIPWWLGGQSFVLDPEAIRSSGLPGAEHAADVLATGGVVVNAAFLIDQDDQVRLAIGVRDQATGLVPPDEQQTVPGAFIPGFAGDLAMSPATAERLGFELPRLVGEYWVTDKPVSRSELDRIDSHLHSSTSLLLVSDSRIGAWEPMQLIPLGCLIALALGATFISLALARTQTVPDLVTMAANGATPGFLRRFGAIQAGVLLAAGVPLGGLLGIALGAYWVAWRRQLGADGAWRLTVIPWPMLLGSWALICLGALIGATLIGRRLPPLTGRRLD